MEGNLRFKIDWASLIAGNKSTIFALFYHIFEGNFPSTSPQGAYPASSGFSRPDATLRRERNHCEHPSASLIETPSSAI